MCHGANRAGTPVFPSLQNLSGRISAAKAAGIFKTGKGQMPAFPNITAEDKKALLDFLFDKEQKKTIVERDTSSPGKRNTAMSIMDGSHLQIKKDFRV